MSLSLEQLRVESPCPAAWAEMAGDDRQRFCQHCQKHVHDLSAMTRQEATDLVCNSAGSLCVRYQHDPQTGQVITLEYARPTRRRWPLVAAMLALCGIGGGLVRWALGKPPPPVVPVLTPVINPPAVVGLVAPIAPVKPVKPLGKIQVIPITKKTHPKTHR